MGSWQAKCWRSRHWEGQNSWTTRQLPFKVSSERQTFTKTLLNLQSFTLGLCVLLGSPQRVMIFFFFFDDKFALTSECVVATSYTHSLTINQLERITEPLPGLQWWGILMRVTKVFSSANVSAQLVFCHHDFHQCLLLLTASRHEKMLVHYRGG